MNGSKRDYIFTLLDGLPGHDTLVQAALIYYHSKIPIEDAKVYIKNLYEKLESKR